MGKLGREALQSKATVNFLLNLASVVATTDFLTSSQGHDLVQGLKKCSETIQGHYLGKLQKYG